MDWLDKHMAEGQRIRDELNSNVITFQPYGDRVENLLAKMRTRLDYLKAHHPQNAGLAEFEEFTTHPDILEMVNTAQRNKIKSTFGGSNVSIN